MRLLITGASGFIGSHVVKAAMARGWEVGSIDVRMITATRRIDVRLLSRIEADCVLHLAAYSSNAGFADNLAENYANNVMGTWNILRLAQQCGTRAVYASSSAVYGNIEMQESDWWENSEEDAIANETLFSHYAKSKLINEMMAASFRNALGLRIFNAYGRGDELKPVGRQAPPTWMQSARRAGKPIVIYGNGTQSKDFIHISDVVECIMRLIESDAVGVVNVGTGVSTSFNDLAELTDKSIDKHAAFGRREFQPIPDPESYQFFTRADTTHLLSIIGPYRFKGVEEGLAV